MQQKRKITLLIRATDGTVSGLDTPEFRKIVPPGKATQINRTRVSHIVPVSLPLRMVFWAIRSVVSDESWLAAFTRKWWCNWQVDLRRSGGKIHGPFSDRNSALDFEHKWVEGRLGAIVSKLNPQRS
jgi:hypothetical protein